MISKANQGLDWDKEQVRKFLSKSNILNFLENLQLTKSIINVTGPY